MAVGIETPTDLFKGIGMFYVEMLGTKRYAQPTTYYFGV